MQPPALRLVMKVVKQAWSSAQVSQCLDQLEEGCFLSASQAAEIMSYATAHAPAPDREKIKFWHVVCSRVVDKWHLTEAEHTQIWCYYGWDGEYAMQV